MHKIANYILLGFTIILLTSFVYSQGEIQKEMVRSYNPAEHEASGIPDYRVLKVKIPAGIMDALLKWNPEFVIYSPQEYTYETNNKIKNLSCFTRYYISSTTNPYMSLSAALADFNGDNIVDAMVVGHDKIDKFFVAVVSDKEKGYNVYPLVSSDIKKYKLYSNAKLLINPQTYLQDPDPPVTICHLFKKGDKWKNMDSYLDYGDLEFQTDGVEIFDYNGMRHVFKWDFRFNKKLIKKLKKIKYYRKFYDEIEFLDYLIDGC
ncbi:MAG TPA: hypothetical protein PK103_06170 [Elusimicrobiales bacterium]|nr:hypothetical protein [Elusimicrobiales bacterium]HOL62934.1 hypothetical protein [Elusimicrobiales bacterium]HPO95820.1 hypothetical protein [Elusimicrobiales bacterium]